jgi:hypothetical protein
MIVRSSHVLPCETLAVELSLLAPSLPLDEVKGDTALVFVHVRRCSRRRRRRR